MSTDQQAQSVRDTFSLNLRRIRRKRELSQEDLAHLTAMHRTEISALERGRREPRLRTLVKLSAALETPLSELLTGIEWRPLVLAPKPGGIGCFDITPPEELEEESVVEEQRGDQRR